MHASPDRGRSQLGVSLTPGDNHILRGAAADVFQTAKLQVAEVTGV